jgi:hypothetical protein
MPKRIKLQNYNLLINLKEAVPFIETASFFLKKSVLVFCKIDILFDFINSTSVQLWLSFAYQVF